MGVVDDRIRKLHENIGRGRPYANGLLEALRLATDPVPDYQKASELVDGVRSMYDMKNRKTLRESPPDDKERQRIEGHLQLFDKILKTLKRKAEEQAREPKPEPATRPTPPEHPADDPQVEQTTERVISVEEENVLSAIAAVNEAVIGLRFVVLDKLVGESAAHRGRVNGLLRSFQNEDFGETRDRVEALMKSLEQNLRVWKREVDTVKAAMDAGKGKYHLRDKEKLKVEMVMVPNSYGIADKQIRRLLNALDIFIR